ncbi:MAG: rhamnogalacturonan lyase, partial [Spirosomataceae bacterium]
YRQNKTGKSTLLTPKALHQVTFWVDSTANLSEENRYVIRLLNGKNTSDSKAFVLPANSPIQSYLSIPLQIPAAGEIHGQAFTYTANDASVGDLDGDGTYEIILKWEPSNGKTPPQTGFTGNQLLDAYRLDGTLLWRIDLGVNIRSGAAYTQFLVYDFDGDGKAELMCKTGDGTKDGQGKILGDATKDWRNTDEKSGFYGKIVEGPEYVTVFEGLTGKALASATYIPTRYPLDGWGGIGGNGGNDNTGGRSDRFSGGVAFLDGIHPSAFFVRGWYGRTVIAAWDWQHGQLSNRWVFDSVDGKNPFSGMANHGVSVADVDADGKDEICVGAMTVDDNGKGLYTTGLRHGDALHIGDLDPNHAGLEVFGVHESEEKTIALNTPGVAMFDAKTGNILFSLGNGEDVGRGVAADIDPTHEGAENWGGTGGLRDVHGKTISEKVPSSTNFVVWWDGDLTRELLDKNRIDKWNWQTNTTDNLLTEKGVTTNNGSKATPCLSADLLGDWREEVIWRSSDNKELRI